VGLALIQPLIDWLSNRTIFTRSLLVALLVASLLSFRFRRWQAARSPQCRQADQNHLRRRSPGFCHSNP